MEKIKIITTEEKTEEFDMTFSMLLAHVRQQYSAGYLRDPSVKIMIGAYTCRFSVVGYPND